MLRSCLLCILRPEGFPRLRYCGEILHIVFISDPFPIKEFQIIQKWIKFLKQLLTFLEEIRNLNHFSFCFVRSLCFGLCDDIESVAELGTGMF